MRRVSFGNLQYERSTVSTHDAFFNQSTASGTSQKWSWARPHQAPPSIGTGWQRVAHAVTQPWVIIVSSCDCVVLSALFKTTLVFKSRCSCVTICVFLRADSGKWLNIYSLEDLVYAGRPVARVLITLFG